jgi:hypothetical protein
MAIFIYAVLGIALLVGSGFIISMGPEWWVPVVTAVSGLACLAMAVYKLEDEYGIFHQFRMKKASKIMEGKFKPRSLNMVPMFIKAYEDRKDCGNGYIMDKAKSNIIRGYKAILKNWRFVAKQTNQFDDLGGEKTVEAVLFDAIESLLTLLICPDGRLDSDYDVYCDICQTLGHKARSKAELKKHFQSMNQDKTEETLKTITFFYSVARRCVAPDKFEALVQGFCYLSLSDNTVFEDEYIVIAMCFFDEDIDTYPKTWAQFKREY